ncbi:MAG TPA: hypothetical protein VF725_11490 [Ktedonobacterales bacterium]
MGTCERCGADAVDGRGLCRNCGWQASASLYDDAPSLGETRAADPALLPPVAGRYPAGGSGYDRMPSAATQAARSPRSGPMGGPMSGPNSGPDHATTRFCGTCGARITGTETFCGQCGAPLNAGSQPGSGAGRYALGGVSSWDDNDAYTEAMPESPTMAASHNPFAVDSYGRSYPQPYGQRGAQVGGMARSTRLTWGIVCLAISIVLALGAIAILVL